MMAPSRIRKSPFGSLMNGAGILALMLIAYFSSSIAPVLQGAVKSIIATRHESEYAGMTREALISKLEDDERLLSRSAYQSILYGALAEENAALRETLNAAQPLVGATGRVLSRPPRTAYDTLLVDVGTDNGVLVGDIAVYEGIALGKIAAAGPRTSTVSLFTAPGVELDVSLGEPRAVAVARGLGGGALELSLPQSVAVMPGDLVTLPGSETLVLGVVRGESSQPTDVSKIVRIASPAALSEIDFVRIIPRAKMP